MQFATDYYYLDDSYTDRDDGFLLRVANQVIHTQGENDVSDYWQNIPYSTSVGSRMRLRKSLRAALCARKMPGIYVVE